MKKGISTVIATLLMLVITIALAGFAYTYIQGIFQSKTAVVLTLEDSSCIGENIQVIIRNDGTTPSGVATVTVTAPDGITLAGACTTPSMNGGTLGSITGGTSGVAGATCGANGLDRASGLPGAAGTYKLRVTGGTAQPSTGAVFCATVGT